MGVPAAAASPSASPRPYTACPPGRKGRSRHSDGFAGHRASAKRNRESNWSGVVSGGSWGRGGGTGLQQMTEDGLPPRFPSRPHSTPPVGQIGPSPMPSPAASARVAARAESPPAAAAAAVGGLQKRRALRTPEYFSSNSSNSSNSSRLRPATAATSAASNFSSTSGQGAPAQRPATAGGRVVRGVVMGVPGRPLTGGGVITAGVHNPALGTTFNTFGSHLVTDVWAGLCAAYEQDGSSPRHCSAGRHNR